jgi:hypothetical protein
MRRRVARREAGVSLLETAMAVSITATVLFAAAAVSKSSIAASSGIGTSSGLSIRCCEGANAVAKLLTNAGLLGEDVNGNGVMDTGEDTNRNGVFDSNWSLANGATANSLTFNVQDATCYWSAPKTFSVVNGVLRLTEGASVREICRNVSSLAFSRNGDLIDVTLTLTASDRTGRSWTATARRRINVRN